MVTIDGTLPLTRRETAKLANETRLATVENEKSVMSSTSIPGWEGS